MPIDDTELRQLIQHIEGAPRRVMKTAEAAAKRGIQNMKNDLVKDARDSKYFKQFANKISYDERYTRRGVEYELGPENDKYTGREQTHGPGAAIAYFGGANGGGGTLDFDGPIEREMPRLEQHLRDTLRDAL